ncbi:hypothetical protein Tco_1189508 [Tanacetum coccineum]
MDIIYDGNSIPEWFTNKSIGNHVKVELPSDWCFNKFRGYGTCVVFKRKKAFSTLKGYSVKNFDGSSFGRFFPYNHREYFEGKPIRINESYMIWLHYMRNTRKWKEANNFVTFCFKDDVDEGYEVKECGLTQVCVSRDAFPSLVLPLVSLSLPLVSLSFQPRTYNLSTLPFRDSVQIWKIPENNLDVLKVPNKNFWRFNDDNANANEGNAEDDVVAHVLDDDDDVVVSDDDEVNPSTNVEEVLSSDDSDDDNRS